MRRVSGPPTADLGMRPSTGGNSGNAIPETIDIRPNQRYQLEEFGIQVEPAVIAPVPSAINRFSWKAGRDLQQKEKHRSSRRDLLFWPGFQICVLNPTPEYSDEVSSVVPLFSLSAYSRRTGVFVSKWRGGHYEIFCSRPNASR